MAKRRIGKLTYWNGEAELENVRWLALNDDGKPAFDRYAQPGKPCARFGTRIGAKPRYLPFGQQPTMICGLRDPADWFPVEREIRVLVKPDPHVCDWRCMGAKPKGDCECECRGRNHGRSFYCEAA